ncbi:UPF0500 protein C1orf216 homolog [Polyodon spathula]|uniref:UPF0500 protein C1orf216 homolog n=1 Tax=Polyodon spathula TaxID=7913 RepID=UPI001B7F25A0|nr:UPF0500 protein C1orf216 homolog [Polyodon spathula]
MFAVPSPAEMDRGTVSFLCLSNQPDRKCMQQDNNFNFLDGEEGEPSLLPRCSPCPPDSNENLNQTRTRQSHPLLLRASLLRASLPTVSEAREGSAHIHPEGAEEGRSERVERGEEEEEEEEEESSTQLSSCSSSSSLSIDSPGWVGQEAWQGDGMGQEAGQGEGAGQEAGQGEGAVQEAGQGEGAVQGAGQGEGAGRGREVAGSCIWGRVFGGAHEAQLSSPVSVDPGQGRGDSELDWDPVTELPGLLGAVRTLQQQESFKAQEKQRHQVQLTMYRRLALIRWLRSLQQSVCEQQGRLQDSYDIILQNRKELLAAAGRGRR